METNRQKRQENLEKIRQLNAAPKKSRTLHHRMERQYEIKAQVEEEKRVAAVLEERHHIYKPPDPEVKQFPLSPFLCKGPELLLSRARLVET